MKIHDERAERIAIIKYNMNEAQNDRMFVFALIKCARHFIKRTLQLPFMIHSNQIDSPFDVISVFDCWLAA